MNEQDAEYKELATRLVTLTVQHKIVMEIVMERRKAEMRLQIAKLEADLEMESKMEPVVMSAGGVPNTASIMDTIIQIQKNQKDLRAANKKQAAKLQRIWTRMNWTDTYGSRKPDGSCYYAGMSL